MGYRVVVQTAETELPAPFLLWGQRQCHTDTDMGGTHCQSAHYCTLAEHKTQLRIFSSSDNDTSNAHVLHRLHQFYGES